MSTFTTVLRICTLRNRTVYLSSGRKGSKAWICGRSLPGFAGSNPAGSMDVCVGECCLLSDRSLCDGLIFRPEKPYRMRFV